MGARAVAARVFDPGLSPGERAFLEVIEPAFSDLVGAADQSLYMAGRRADGRHARRRRRPRSTSLMRALEERVGLLEVLRGPRQRPAVPADRVQTGFRTCRGLSLVAANYGLLARNLGTVSLIGPTRMDYTFAIRSVRGAAAAAVGVRRGPSTTG